MSNYNSIITAYAEDEIAVRIFKARRHLQRWGQDSYMCNVTINKFKKDIDKKVQKMLAKAVATRIEQLEAELIKLKTLTEI